MLQNPTEQKNTPIFYRDIWEKKVEFGLRLSFFLFRKKDNKQGTSYDATEDEDVRDERENIENNENNPDTILKIHKLTKVFRRALGHRNIAVNDISIGVKSGEVRGIHIGLDFL